MNVHNNKKGFTIIEVVLVLAIAALIFLMIFIALPALQKGQRDTARKQDATTISAALGTFRSNRSGSMPSVSTTTTGGTSTAAPAAGSFNDFKDKYLKKLSQIDVAKVKSTASTASAPASTALDDDGAEVRLGKNCDDAASSRYASIYVKMESSGDVVCTDA